MRIYLTILMFFLLNSSKAQEGVPIYFDYLTENYYLVHPSMAGVNLVGGKIRMTARKQWFDQVEAPNLQTLTADLRLSERSGLGLTLFNDQNGYHSQKGAYITYAHHINFNDNIVLSKRPYPSKYDEIDQLSFGISVGGIQNSLDQSTFDLVDYDPLISGLMENTGYFNVDVGMSYVNSKYYAHLTLKNLLFAPDEWYGETNNGFSDTRNYKRLVASLGYVFYTDTPWSFEPSTLFQYSNLTTERSIDINFKAYYKLNYGRIWAGLSFRNSLEGAEYIEVSTGNIKEQSLQLVTPLFGIDFKDFVFSYNYSHQFGDINFGSGGFHQITIGFNFLRGSIDCDCF
ncbi:MAG: type IX secretion system membrane protein PorP/SprF [Flavobacteriaceae bacterium]